MHFKLPAHNLSIIPCSSSIIFKLAVSYANNVTYNINCAFWFEEFQVH